MKNMISKVACLVVIAGLIGGCSMNDKNSDKNMNKVKDAADKTADKTKNGVNDSIDNVMDYFKKEGVKFENSKKLENIEFAASEGRSFDMNGKTAYLYHVKSNDENMKKILKEAKDKGTAKVNIDNKEQMYGAKVNGDYLLLYDTQANMNDMLNTFPNYRGDATNKTSNNAKETDKTTTSENTQKNDSKD